jgi:hypothetical protein
VLSINFIPMIFAAVQIPAAAATAAYLLQAVLSIIVIPMIFTPVKWYYVAVAYLVAPLLLPLLLLLLHAFAGTAEHHLLSP